MPLDRGLPSYKSVDDLRTTLYVCDWWHTQHLQNLDRGRLMLTRHPLTNTALPYTYAIFYEAQGQPHVPCTLSATDSAGVSVEWRGNVLVVALDRDDGRYSSRRGQPHNLEPDEQESITSLLLG